MSGRDLALSFIVELRLQLYEILLHALLIYAVSRWLFYTTETCSFLDYLKNSDDRLICCYVTVNS